MPVSNMGSAELTVRESCRQGIKWIMWPGRWGREKGKSPPALTLQSG